MARWSLCRQHFGTEEFDIKEGDEVTIGRDIDNIIMLHSIVVSRHHCVINVQKDKVLITDLKSSNGVYVGKKKIPPNTPYVLKETDIIGFGWTIGVTVQIDIEDIDKFIFRLSKKVNIIPNPDKIQFQSDDELEELESKLASLEDPKPQLKRKHDVLMQDGKIKIKAEVPEVRRNRIVTIDDDIINLLSDSDSETNNVENNNKRQKLEPDKTEPPNQLFIKEEQIKTEKEDLEYEAFNVKKEHFETLNDEPIDLDSDTDSDNEHWIARLSQSSPGKPFTKLTPQKKTCMKLEESSYSQLDDIFDADNENNSEEEYEEDLITIPPYPPEENNSKIEMNAGKHHALEDPEEEFFDDIISLVEPVQQEKSAIHTSKNEKNKDVTDSGKPTKASSAHEVGHDIVGVADGINNANVSLLQKPEETVITKTKNENAKTMQLIQPLTQSPKKRHNDKVTKSSSESKHKSSSKHKKEKKHSSCKRHISNSQKEERKKKLKEIATKDKEESKHKSSSSSKKQDKASVNAKISTSNRGAFLTDDFEIVTKPIKRKESPRKKSKCKLNHNIGALKESMKSKVLEHVEDIENNKKQVKSNKHVEPIENKKKQEKTMEENKTSKVKDRRKSEKDIINFDEEIKSVHSKSHKTSMKDTRVPFKSLKLLTDSDGSFSGKLISKIEPIETKKPKKSVRFSKAAPTVHIFEIEDGNKLKKTSLCRTNLVDVRQKPAYSLEKMTLKTILRWNPQWLDEQINNKEPPPILGHDNPPMTIFHSFNSHGQYVQLVGDLLLMEIWECLTQGHMRIRGQTAHLQMRIEHIPPAPTQDRHNMELFSFSVNLSVLNSEIRTAPKVGEVMTIAFGPERTRRFFFVNNIRCLPSPPNNKYSFFSVSLQTCYTEKMQSLKQGELITGQVLAYINNELALFGAIEYLAGSPLSDAILRPEPRHFVKKDANPSLTMNSRWTKTLNPSQLMAVGSSVAAALSEVPAIQMVQGPPGTGKSCVISSIVMTYFYDSQGRKLQNRGKVLVCATSNAAVDALVLRLLQIRQDLPKDERFRMVRVGRTEAMHPRAFDVSSQSLAQRDAARLQAAAGDALPGLVEEISHLEAKINMWKTQLADAKDPVRVAYCQTRISQLQNRISLLRAGGGGAGGAVERMRGERLAQGERRIIEGADIVVTTLASACNPKMRGLKGRIALCVVDEAGQAIEPETLIPLTLDVTKLTLVGDPQQLPGYICSQRAKKHGLGESLFSRLTSISEHWESGSPVVLLNQQYRMHPDIADYPNRAFYAGLIRTVPLPRPDINLVPYSIVSITSGDKGQGVSGANEFEAWGVARLAAALGAVMRAQGLSLAVITPYNAQKDVIKKNLRLLQDPAEPQVEVNTVDSFQGQERDVVVVSLARSQGVGFLTDAGRMNVMLTRARHALLVCLNPHATLKNEQWRTLVEDAQRRKLYRMLPNKVCQSPSAGKFPREEILKYVTYENPKT